MCRRLELRAAGQRTDVDGIRAAVLSLLSVDDYIDYDGAREYANDITRAAEAIGELVEAGAGTQAIEVARDAIGWLRESLGMVDDSSGDVGSAAYELLYVHLLACEAAPPDPVVLADYLAGLWLADQYGLVPAFNVYAELLGDAGATALRERMTTAYEADPDNSHVQHVLESVLEAENDVDGLVALYTAHLDQFGWQYLDIYRQIAEHLIHARACHKALGTTDEFQRYMALLRTAQKRKRNLMKILDKSGL